MNRYVVAVTGASGMIYARELLAYFSGRPDLELHAVISGAGEQVLSLELGTTPAADVTAAVAALNQLGTDAGNKTAALDAAVNPPPLPPAV